jgi:AraC family transcriptional regulator, dual regulator of chb operon
MLPPRLRFSDRTFQGPHFHLVSVEWARNRLPGYHRHDYAEIFWLTEGACEHRINGRVERLDAGHVLLLRPDDAHQLRPWRGGSFRFTNLSLSPDCFERLKVRYPEEFERLYARTVDPLVLALSRAELGELNAAMLELAGASHSLFSLEKAVMDIWNRFLPRANPAAGDTPDWLRDAMVQLDEQELFSRGASGLVELAGRSHAHVARICRRHLGQTPTELVNAARLRFAVHALRMGSRSVLDISLDCGFENPAQFHRLFRAAFGTTPGRYRRE